MFLGNGAFYLNGIFPFESIGKINYQSGIMMGEAMKYAVERVNNDTESLHGYTFEVKELYGSSSEDSVRDYVLGTFLTKVPFLIGPYSSETSYVASILTKTFKQITVSYSAFYSDFDIKAMFRTVSSNFYRVRALLDLVKRLEWNYLAVINSYGHDGDRDAMSFISKFSSIGACLGEQIDLPRQRDANNESFDSAVASLQKDNRIKAIVLFTTNDDSRRIMLALKRKKLEGFYRIICAFGCTNYIEVVEGIEDVALGTISLDIHYKSESGFETYFLSRTPRTSNNTQFIKFWEKIFNCSVNLKNNISSYSGRTPCTGEEKLKEGKGYYPLTPIHTVTNAVYSIAYALKLLVKEYCHKDRSWMVNVTSCVVKPDNPHEYSEIIFKKLFGVSYHDGTLKSLDQAANEYQYDIHLFTKKSEKYKSIHIGKWTFNKSSNSSQYDISELDARFELELMQLREYRSENNFRAICSEECNVGYVRIRDSNPQKSKCCWSCQQCPPNNIVRNNSCLSCDKTEMVVAGSCMRLPERYLDINESPGKPFQVAMLLLCVAGLSLTFYVIMVFIKFNGNRIVRAYGRDLCYLILTGVAMLFLCPFPFLVKPSTISCVFRGSLPGIAFLACYAPLFLKINRIYRIFLHAQTSVARPALVSTKSLLLTSFGIVSLQFLLAAVWLVSEMPHPAPVVPHHRKYIMLTCTGESSPMLMPLNLVLSVIFMISSTILAFKTRNFPKNYNESKYIGITLYITCVSWALFFPGYFFASSGNMEFLREYLMCTICVLIGYITLLGLFGLKVKLLCCTSKEKLNEKSKEGRGYTFSFENSHTNDLNGLTMEQVI